MSELGLREAAQRLVDDWDGPDAPKHDLWRILKADIEVLRVALAALESAGLDVERLAEAARATFNWSPTHAWNMAQRIAAEYVRLRQETPDREGEAE